MSRRTQWKTKGNGLITLTTDFGTTDWFVGTMKGVILRINPRAALVDISHYVPAGDVRAGALTLAASYRFFPAKTVHLVVVDPGVGSARAGLAIETEDYFFVGPDNGVLSWALNGQKVKAAYRLENKKLFLHPVSRTFHGRDIFAPAAAHLSVGVPYRALGPRQFQWEQLQWPRIRRQEGAVCGQVIYVDRFGNSITNLREGAYGLDSSREGTCLAGRVRCPLRSHYDAVPMGKPVAIWGSSGLLEVAVNGGSAAKRLGLKVGSPIRFLPKPMPPPEMQGGIKGGLS